MIGINGFQAGTSVEPFRRAEQNWIWQITWILLSVGFVAGCRPDTNSEPPRETFATQPTISNSQPEKPSRETGQPNPSAKETPHDEWTRLQTAVAVADANRLAERQVRSGTASVDQSLSLLTRNRAFPPASWSRPGLTTRSQAMWHFDRREYDAALRCAFRSVDSDSNSSATAGPQDSQIDTDSAEWQAFHGRLLAEAQRLDELPAWLEACDDETRRHAHFWAALGIWLGSHQKHRAAVGASLQAIRMDPTDQLTVQRVGNWLHALDQENEAELFYRRARAIAETIALRDQWHQLQEVPQSPKPKRLADSQTFQVADLLAKQLMEAGRPFESFQWTLHQLDVAESILRVSTQSMQKRRLVLQKMNALSQTPDIAAILAEEHILQMQPSEFPFQPDLREVLAASVANHSSEHNDDLQEINMDASSIKLQDVAGEVGLQFRFWPREHRSRTSNAFADDLTLPTESLRMHEALGSGIGVLDFDRDGWPDLVFGQGDCDPPNLVSTSSDQLFRNLGGTFRNETQHAGYLNRRYAFGVAVGDINQDGFDDLFIANLGVNVLLINNADGTFRESTSNLGDQSVPGFEGAFTTSAAIADLNGDGLPDLFEANYVEREGLMQRLPPDENGRVPQKTPRSLFAEPDRVWLQKGSGGWRVQTIGSDVARPGTSLGLIIGNLTREGSAEPDKQFDMPQVNEVLVGNDARPNHFLRRSKEMTTWSESATVAGLANNVEGLPTACMGIAAADFDQNGGLDFFITNFSTESVSLFLKNNSGAYTDQCVRKGLSSATRPMVGFGCKAMDLNRDGWLDVCLVNGHIDDLPGEDYKMPPQCFLGRGKEASTDTSDPANRTLLDFVPAIPNDPNGYWTTPALGRVMARVDYNRDGRSDLVVNHLDKDVALLRNDSEGEGHSIRLDLIGTISERDAIGARVEVQTDAGKRFADVVAGDGYMCTDESVVEIPLGLANPETVTVHWPSGSIQQFAWDNEWTGRLMTIVEGQSFWW
ncbi:FG-GAP-like repeat-containing protein [Rhodopirellula halodulae]|uniref:FG-GAP-like repeat-containing protein n=1 Tax=Rhodopirellula halodulae TaxID=2894198 RepID=UPI001E5E360C|nr:FG-GAP-like repeat-containing protein [Rhodopirellula sp. JC737]MCC9656649.1 FG-GAP-like repeat-containing protein [Rhodopirellula sp. JC737]